MFPLADIFPEVIANIIVILLEPLFWIIFLVIVIQYKRMAKTREDFFGVKDNDYLRQAGIATVFGLLGGLAGSLVMIIIGINLDGSGLYYLWMVAILLMFIDARFLCFAYAGGIVSLSSLIFGFPEIDIAQVIGLVAVLHMVESVLILLSGHLGAVPVYIKNSANKIVGGFTLQKFWPIPIVALIIVGMETGVMGASGEIHMPDWWPLIKPFQAADDSNYLYALLPVVAGVGYGDIAITKTPVQKAKTSFLYLSLYSVILLLLAVLGSNSLFFLILAALFSPIGHELVIYFGKKSEITGEALYKPPDKGVKALDIIPKSPAWKLGIRSGDIIKTINNNEVNNKNDLFLAVSQSPWFLEVEFLQEKTNRWYREQVKKKVEEDFGLLPVPEGHEGIYMEFKSESMIGTWLKKVTEKRLRKNRNDKPPE